MKKFQQSYHALIQSDEMLEDNGQLTRFYAEFSENTLCEIPHSYNVSNTGEQFVHYNNRRDDRLIIFGTRESFKFLENRENWFMDGTFSTAPPQFAQLYTFHGLSNGKNTVGAYCLLVNKRMETYVELLSRIHLLTNQVVPESIMTDFKQSMIGPITSISVDSPKRMSFSFV